MGLAFPTMDIGYSGCLALGAGFQYMKLGMEMRYYAKRDLLRDYLKWESNFTTFAVIFKYSLF